MDVIKDIEISKYISSIAVAIITVIGKFLITYLTRNGERIKTKTTNLEFIDKIINEREWKKLENRFILEETFEQIYSKPISFHEIKILLYADTPSIAFRTYLRYRPALELNKEKTKFRFKSGQRPYFNIRKLRIPKSAMIGFVLYSIFAFPASFAMTWLIDHGVTETSIKLNILFWVLDLLTWFVAIMLLINGIKYQSSEKELLKDLGNKLEK